jgi:hypothetical protein
MSRHVPELVSPLEAVNRTVPLRLKRMRDPTSAVISGLDEVKEVSCHVVSVSKIGRVGGCVACGSRHAWHKQMPKKISRAKPVNRKGFL